MALCIPLAFGCPTKIKQEGEIGQARICPNCHNASVIQARSRTWFEFCFVPLFPFSTDHIWLCSICNWQIEQGGSWQPQIAGAGYAHPGQFQQPGYGPPQAGYMISPVQQQQYPPKQQSQGFKVPG